ncbi:hypothetical protein [Brevundimonas sp.]|uniref:alpha-glutamyl/putrescinyl thymine pyrophosphorylase clade 3 protein n=1 Tax=Brevundimonas sp. TaxID=1871086 RepID=UPI002CBF7D6C|nr:hypothetical protein [Brevundimonas sp.]HWQ85820.1 hypothetical protein [Brevundimonas sp.]
MRVEDQLQIEQLETRLLEFDANKTKLPGIATAAARDSLKRQIIDSIHRVEYVRRIGDRAIDPRRANPDDELFDPIKAAWLHLAKSDLDEACWLVFLSTHFGFHHRAKWALTRAVYGALGSGESWTWKRVSQNPGLFRDWFRDNAEHLKGMPFGNHRKYESLRWEARENLADTVASYIAWVGPNRGHDLLFQQALADSAGDPKGAFEALYLSMNVRRFGRTARFDYLTMLGKLSLANIDPPHPYFGNATGPIDGANLLFGGSRKAELGRAYLSDQVVELGNALGLNMQIMEDSLCNWQKSPNIYRPFRG